MYQINFKSQQEKLVKKQRQVRRHPKLGHKKTKKGHQRTLTPY